MRLTALCILLVHSVVATADDGVIMAKACDLHLKAKNKQMAKEGRFDEIETAEGWLGHVPKILRWPAVKAVVATKGPEALINAGVSAHLDLSDRALLAEEIKNSDPGFVLKNLKLFGLQQAQAITIGKDAIRECLTRNLPPEKVSQLITDIALMPAPFKTELAVEFISALANYSAVSKIRHVGSHLYEPNKEQAAKVIGEAMSRLSDLGIVSRAQRERAILRLLLEAEDRGTYHYWIIAQLWKMGPVSSAVQAAYLKKNKSPTDVEMKFNLSQEDSIEVWNSIYIRDPADISERQKILDILNLPDPMFQEAVFRPFDEKRSLFLPTAVARAVFQRRDRELSLKFLKHYGDKLWEHNFIRSFYANDHYLQRRLGVENSGLTIKDIIPHMTTASYFSNDDIYGVMQIFPVTKADVEQCYKIMFVKNGLNTLSLYLHDELQEWAAFFAKYGIKIDTRVTTEMAEKALAKHLEDAGSRYAPPGGYDPDTALRFTDLLPTRAARIEYLKAISAGGYFKVVLEGAAKFKLTPEELNTIANVRKADDDTSTKVLLTVKDAKFSREKLFQLLSGDGFGQAFPYLMSFDETTRFEAAIVFVRRHATAAEFAKIRTLERFGIAKTKDKLKIVAEILRAAPATQIESIASSLGLSGLNHIALQRVRFVENMEYILNQHLQVTENRQMNPAAPVEDLVGVIESYAKLHPKIIPPGLATSLGLTLKRREICLKTIRLFFRLNGYAIPKVLPENPEQVWADGLGIPLDSVRLGLKSERFANVIDLLLDTETALYEPPYKGFPLPASLFENKNLPRLVTMASGMRDWLKLRGDSPASWRELLAEAAGNGRTDDLVALSSYAGEQVVKAVQILFAERKISFTYEQFLQLKERWGDLEPVYTLIARYNSKLEWQPRIKDLAVIFEAEVNNTFAEWKFKSEKARKQIPMFMYSKQIDEWMKIRTRLTLFDPAAAKNTGISVQGILDIVSSNVQTHYTGWQGHTPTEGLLEFIRENKGSPNEVLQKIEAQFYPEAKEAFAAAFSKDLLTYMITKPTLENLGTTSWALKVYKRLFNLNPELLADLEEINTKLRGHQVQAKSEVLIFTTTMWDAKSLLTVGDAVPVTSCQNYRTGGYIQTLPGYVEHAGVQAIETFVIDRTHFEKEEDFDTIKNALATNQILKSEFGSTHVNVRFELNGGQIITTKALGRAFNRHIMKAGQMVSDDKRTPGIMIERAYHLNHQADGIFSKQVHEIVTEVATATGARTGGRMTMYKSENGGGIYSDAAGGIRTSDYEVDIGGIGSNSRN